MEAGDPADKFSSRAGLGGQTLEPWREQAAG